MIKKLLKKSKKSRFFAPKKKGGGEHKIFFSHEKLTRILNILTQKSKK